MSARTRHRGSFFRNLVRTLLPHAVDAMTFVITSHLCAGKCNLLHSDEDGKSTHLYSKGAACFCLQR